MWRSINEPLSTDANTHWQGDHDFTKCIKRLKINMTLASPDQMAGWSIGWSWSPLWILKEWRWIPHWICSIELLVQFVVVGGIVFWPTFCRHLYELSALMRGSITSQRSSLRTGVAIAISCNCSTFTSNSQLERRFTSDSVAWILKQHVIKVACVWAP